MAEKSKSGADEAKDRMRAALEAKKQGLGAGPHAQAAGGAKASGAHAKAGGKREFRRKSGG